MNRFATILSPLMLALAAAMPGAAAAHVNGAGQCRVDLGEFPVLHYKSVRTPTTIANANRGDVLLTQGISTNPVSDLLAVLNQLYVHTSILGNTDVLGTRVTHTTALTLGKKLIELHVTGVRFKPEWLRRLPPGNVVRDPLDTVLNGDNSQCLSFHEPADCMNARSRSHVRTGTMLLKPKPGFEAGAVAAADWAESRAPHTYGYSVSAYSELEDAWTNTGIDSSLVGEKPGAMCSSMVMKALNFGGIPIANQTYSQSGRRQAATALFSAVHSSIAAEVGSFVGGWVGVLPPIAAIQLGLANQVVGCFAFGGNCGLPFTAPVWALAPLGTGHSTSPDDLIPNDLTYASISATRNGVQPSHWATMSAAGFAGGQTYQVFDYLECCLERNGTRICRIPGQWGQHGNGDPFRTAGNGSPKGEEASAKGRKTAQEATERREDKQEDLALEVARWISEVPGKYRDQNGSHCYITERGEICVVLPKDAASSDPTPAERPADAADAAAADPV